MVKAPRMPVQEYFQIKRHGDVAVIVPSPEVETLSEATINTAAQMVIAPLKSDPLLWGIFAGLFVATAVTGSELAVLFLLTGSLLCLRVPGPGPAKAA